MLSWTYFFSTHRRRWFVRFTSRSGQPCRNSSSTTSTWRGDTRQCPWRIPRPHHEHHNDGSSDITQLPNYCWQDHYCSVIIHILFKTILKNLVVYIHYSYIIVRTMINKQCNYYYSHLLSDQSDPFNRSPLSMDQVKSNTELKERIYAWIAEQKRNIAQQDTSSTWE